METWPEFLPKWLLADQSVVAEHNFLRSTQPGKVSQRSLSRRVNKTLRANLYLSGAQVPIFEYFIRDRCNEGANWFTGYFSLSSGPVLTRIRLVNGAYNYQLLPKGARGSCEVEVR